MAYLLEKRMCALPSPREKGRMTMATFLLSSVKSCEGGHGLCHHLREKRGSSLLTWLRTLVILRARRADLLFFRSYAMITSTALY